MTQSDMIFALLKKDLTAPRVLMNQVVNYINDHYGFPEAELERFFKEKYPYLEDYEVDLTFSPQYTPADHNRLEYIPILGDRALLPEEVNVLKRRLNDADLYTVLKTADGQTEIAVPLHEAFIGRYVNLLHLDHKLPPGFYSEMVQDVAPESRSEINLLARDEAWQGELRQDILTAFLKAAKGRKSFSVQKISYLTSFVRTYRPAGLPDMGRQLDSLIKSCQDDMENVSGRGFHDEYLRALHGSDRLNLADEKDVFFHYKQMVDMAYALKEDYAYILENMPELMEKASRQTV